MNKTIEEITIIMKDGQVIDYDFIIDLDTKKVTKLIIDQHCEE